MRDQHWLRGLQMRVCRHRRLSGSLGFIEDCIHEFDELHTKLIDRVTHKQAQIGSDLLIAAAACMQFQANIPGEFNQPALEEMVNVLGFAVFEKSSIALNRMLHMGKGVEQRLQLRCGEHAHSGKRTSVCAAGSHLLRQKSFVKRKRPLPLLEFRIQRPAEPARPHLHADTASSSGVALRRMARERAGSPRMRMKPAASFWS